MTGFLRRATRKHVNAAVMAECARYCSQAGDGRLLSGRCSSARCASPRGRPTERLFVFCNAGSLIRLTQSRCKLKILNYVLNHL
jgi:hypothetical protein